MTNVRLVIVGAVDYPDLCDHSAGLLACERLMVRGIAPDVLVEDLSFNPVAVGQRLADEHGTKLFTHVIFVAAIARGDGRAPGTVTAYRWDGALPAADEVHRAVCDAVTGIINVDNTLIVTKQFNALPEVVCVVEIEPLEHEFGHALSSAVQSAIEPACALIAALATDTERMERLPVSALGGGSAAAIR